MLKKNPLRINAVRRINPNKIRIIGVYSQLKNWICQHSLTFSSLPNFRTLKLFFFFSVFYKPALQNGEAHNVNAAAHIELTHSIRFVGFDGFHAD